MFELFKVLSQISFRVAELPFLFHPQENIEDLSLNRGLQFSRQSFGALTDAGEEQVERGGVGGEVVRGVPGGTAGTLLLYF